MFTEEDRRLLNNFIPNAETPVGKASSLILIQTFDLLYFVLIMHYSHAELWKTVKKKIKKKNVDSSFLLKLWFFLGGGGNWPHFSIKLFKFKTKFMSWHLTCRVALQQTFQHFLGVWRTVFQKKKKIRQTKVIQNQTKLKIKQLKLNSNKINQCEHQHKQEEKEAREESN